MSRPSNPEDPLSFSDPSATFGRDEGLNAYMMLVEDPEHLDLPVHEIATRAARMAALVANRFDVDHRRVADAIVHSLESQLLPRGESDE